MNPEVSLVLKNTIESFRRCHLDCFYWHAIEGDLDKLELLAKEKEDSISLVVIIRLTVSQELREIYISNIFMPASMRRRGLGKDLIAKIYGAAGALNCSLFLVQMTEGFFDRMVRRGATVIVDKDCVQINDRTNLRPNA